MPANVASMPAPVCPESRLKNTEGAAKLGWTGHSIDASLSYFDGWDHIATTLIHVNPQTNQPTLASAFYRTKMIGADIAGQLFTFGVWAEGAYFITEDDQGVDPNIKNPYAQFTLGADYQFPNELKVNVQYFQEVITQVDDDAEQTQEEAILTKLGIGLPVQQAASCRIEWKFGASKSNRLELFGLSISKKMAP